MTQKSELPLVTVITPVYNGSKYLNQLITSVHDQDYPNVEHIVIDDGSTDNGATVQILKTYPHLRWWSRENRGPFQTMNEALQEAHGDYVCFIHSDDIMSPGAISKAMGWLRDHRNYDAVYGLAQYFSESGNTLRLKHSVRYAAIRYYPYFAHIQHCSLYISKQVLCSKGLIFNPEIRFVADYDWIIRMLNERIRIGFTDDILSTIRVHENQISTLNRTKMADSKKKVARRYGYGGLKYAFYTNILHLLNFFDLFLFPFQKAGIKDAFNTFIIGRRRK